MLDRPLYIADMTFYEFIRIIELISKLDNGLTSKERITKLKKEIYEMLGIIPRDEGKPPRKLSSSKEKMVQNFMVTINQLQLLDNLDKSKDLYQLLTTDKDNFYLKLRNLLLYHGNLYEYVRAIEKVNSKKEFTKSSEYLDKIAYEIFKKFPHITVGSHRKQVSLILKWLRDEKLGLFEVINRNGVNIYQAKIRL